MKNRLLIAFLLGTYLLLEYPLFEEASQLKKDIHEEGHTTLVIDWKSERTYKYVRSKDKNK